MLRGYTQFKCTQCGHTFNAPDIEYRCTSSSQPQPCPQCGSRHTCPTRDDTLIGRRIYKEIWKQIDNE
ncbi:MAG: hypothetical protein MJZ24_09100 [Paludibacteraceae bacterium]|nr:hypothetical protein [Paludibacteraceae bacterium]